MPGIIDGCVAWPAIRFVFNVLNDVSLENAFEKDDLLWLYKKSCSTGRTKVFQNPGSEINGF